MRRIRPWTTVAVVAAAVAVACAGIGVSVWAVTSGGGSLPATLLSGAVVVAFSVVGAVVVAARPGNRVGWLMLAGGVLWSAGNAGADLAHLGLVDDPGRVPAVSVVAVAGSALRALGFYLVVVGVPMFFPDGRLAGPRWRWLPRLLVVVLVAAVVGPVVDVRADLVGLGDWRNPLAPGGRLEVLSGLAFLASVPLSLVALVGVAVQLVGRWRRGTVFARQQLTVLALAVGLALLALPVAVATNAGWVFSAATLPLPVAVGFAVLARGLYDLRTAANRTLVWTTLSAAVAGVYALVIAGVDAMLHLGEARWVPWVSAAVVAVTFAPLRDGLQRGVNRLTYGRWEEPYEVLAGLGQRLEASADVDRLLGDVVDELHGLGLRDVVLTDADGSPVVDDDGPDAPVTVPLSAYGRDVGLLRYRPPDTGLRARDQRLLDDLAGHLGGVLHAHRLTADLERARESLVLAREEERRRLRRDLHDGLGPALAGHLLRLDVLAGKIGPRSSVRADVDALREELRTTVLEVRRVVEGLRPPALDELGLAGALAQATSRLTAGSGTVVDLEVAELPPLPAAVEVAAFRIVTEAVTNAVRHAGAARCLVRVEVTRGDLAVVVADDGRGVGPGSATAGGHGLQTMRERCEELRGRFAVTDGGGTTVSALIPVRTAGRSRRRPAAAGAR